MKSHVVLVALAAALSGSCAYDAARIPAAAEAGERPEDFSGLLRQRASRVEVELTAALGGGYRQADVGRIRTVRNSLATTGRFEGYPATPFGNRVVRVSRCEEAHRELTGTWPAERFAADSDLARLFVRHPRASVVSMDADDQQILFFDPQDRLAAVYPGSTP